jgi:hypothetical protein
MQFFGSLRGGIFYSMAPPSSYVKTIPYQATCCSSGAFVNPLQVTTQNFNVVSFGNKFLFFSILISEFQFS